MKSRHVSAGFIASEIEKVERELVFLKDGRWFPLSDLNGREEDEVREFLKKLSEKTNF